MLTQEGAGAGRADLPTDLPRKHIGGARLKLTTTTIKTLALPAGKTDHIFFDDDLPGFGLRLRASGTRKWVVQYDFAGRTRRMLLGPADVIDPGVARRHAKDVLAARTLGRDPANEKSEARERAAETFGALLLTRYLPHKQAQLKAGARSFKEVDRHLVKYARPLHARPVTAIDRRAVAALVSAVAAKNGPTAANCMLGSLSGYFTWLIREGLIEGVNPASYVNKAPQSKGRDRVLAPDEFREIWNALGDSDYADIFRLLALTGARKSEIGSLRWDEIDFDNAEINLSAARTKNNRPHTIPLTPFGARHPRGTAAEWARICVRLWPRFHRLALGQGSARQAHCRQHQGADVALGAARLAPVLLDHRA